MDDYILGLLREAQADLSDVCGSKTRELSMVITKIDEAILWRQEDLRKKVLRRMNGEKQLRPERES